MKTETDNFIYRPFPIQLRGYYGQYVAAQGSGMEATVDDPLNASLFVAKVNRYIAKADDKITVAMFREMLSGKRSPDAAHVTALAQALVPEVSLYGDTRENFIESVAATAITKAPAGSALEEDEAAKTDRIVKLSGVVREQERHIQEHDAQIRNRTKMVEAWKRTTPKRVAGKKSFGAMVEEAYHANIRFKPFLENVLVEWDISPVELCAHMEKLNSKKADMPKKTLTDSVLYQWMNHPKNLPNTSSVLLMRDTFALDEQHELMLWKVIGGKQIDDIDKVIALASGKKGHGPLVKKLVEASGIPDVHIQKLVGVGQLPAWKRGAVIEKKEAARRFVDLVHPPANATDEKTHAENLRILALITKRPQSIGEAIEEAREAEHPGGMLFLKLTGRHGLVSLSDAELAAGLSVKGNKKQKIEADPVSDHMVRKMRRSKLERGGFIHERHATKILDMVTAKLKEEGTELEITPGEREECLEMMTGIANVKTLFALCREDELTAGELLRLTRDRRGLTQMQAESKQEIGLASISEFERGKNTLQHESARKVAKWLGLEEEDARDFVVMATGKQHDLTPQQLLAQAKDPHQRCRSLRRIFDATGLTREELADKAGIDYGQIMYATQKRSGGRILAGEDQIVELACLCGLKEQVGDFMATFGSTWEERVIVPVDDKPRKHNTRADTKTTILH